jgi:hypothetical protein
MNVASGSAFDLYSIAYRRTRDHLDRVRLPAFPESEVQEITWLSPSWPAEDVIWRRVFSPRHPPLRQVGFHRDG